MRVIKDGLAQTQNGIKQSFLFDLPPVQGSAPQYLKGRSRLVIEHLIQIARLFGSNYELRNSSIFPILYVLRIYPSDVERLKGMPTELQKLMLGNIVFSSLSDKCENEIWAVFTCSPLGAMNPMYNEFLSGAYANMMCYDPCFEILASDGEYYPMSYRNNITGETHTDIFVKDGKIEMCTEQQALTKDVCDLWLQDIEIQQKLKISDSLAYAKKHYIILRTDIPTIL